MERRLAAILATDVVGYSRLIRADEEGTIAALKVLRADIIDPKISEHSGRIVKLMGDGMLAEFQSVVDAVRAAVETRQAVAERNSGLPEHKRIEFRVGINLGDVVIDGDDIQGDGVNVAARLEGLAEPGGIYISGSVHEQVRDHVNVAFDDLGEQKVKNIDRPVRIWRVAGAQAEPEPPVTDKPLAISDKPTIAVLAFNNMSGDKDQEYFADGIAEDIITALSRFHWFFVIARNSSFSYKGTSPDVRQVAAELGVQYVLEGSVRKSGSRVRISAQLIDATTGRHVWAESYDRELHDIFAVQDEITEAITGAVAPSFVTAEIHRASNKSADHLTSWDLAMQGSWHLWQMTKQDFTEAKRLFQTAIELSPDNSVALSHLGLTYILEAGAGLAKDPVENRNLAYQAAQRAIAKDDQDAWAHTLTAWVKHLNKENEAALRACRNALQLNPNLAYIYGVMGLAHAHLGNHEEAKIHIDNAIRLSPRDHSLPIWYLARVVSALVARQTDRYLEKAIDLTEAVPDFVVGWRHLAAAYAMLDRLEDAETAIRRVMELAPHDTIESVRSYVPIVDAQARDLYFKALRKAGLPD